MQQISKAAAHDFAGLLSINKIEPVRDLLIVAGSKIKLGFFANLPQNAVFGFIRPVGNIGKRKIRQALQHKTSFLRKECLLFFKLGNSLLQKLGFAQEIFGFLFSQFLGNYILFRF